MENEWKEKLQQHLSAHTLPKNTTKSEIIAYQDALLAKIDIIRRDLAFPLSFSPLPIKDLITNQPVGCYSNLKTGGASRLTRTRLTDQLAAQESLVHVRFLIIGYLRANLQSLELKEENLSGQLYIEDLTGCLLCEFQEGHLIQDWLNHLVLIPSWNYIPFRSSQSGFEPWKGPYLEVTDLLEVINISEAKILELPQFNVVYPSTAFYILYHRKEVNVKKINLMGRLTAKSPVLRIRNFTFFVIYLTCQKFDIDVPVVIKGHDMTYWYNFLHIFHDYIISDLIPTTVNKGTKSEYMAYAATKNTIFFLEKNVGTKNVRLQEILKIDGKEMFKSTGSLTTSGETTSMAESNFGNTSLTISDSLLKAQVAKKKKSKQFYSYEGIITEIISVEAGIYLLDNKIRLYISYLSCPTYGRGLRIGAKIKVYNAHLTKHKKYKLLLICCSLSSVVVEEFSIQNSTYKAFLPQASVYIHLLYILNPSITLFQNIIDCGERIKEKLVPDIISNKVLFGLKKDKKGKLYGPLYDLFAKKNWEPLIVRKPRNIYTELFNIEHECSVLGMEPNENQPFDLPTLSSVKKKIEDKAFEKSSWILDESLPLNNSKALNDSVYWKYMVFKPEDFDPPMVLLGSLRANEKTGRLQLVDQTGQIDCVISEINDDCMNDIHECKDSCFEFHKLKSSCPKVCIQDLHKCLVINKFVLVLERFVLSNFPEMKYIGDEAYIQDFHLQIYICFSMKDALCMHQSDPPRKAVKRKQKFREDNVGEQMRTCKKQELHDQSIAEVSSNRIDKTDVDITFVFFIQNKTALHTIETVERHELNFSSTSYFIGKPILSGKNLDKFDEFFGDSIKNGGNFGKVHMTFNGDNVKWYNILHIGQFYRLTISNDKCFTPVQLQRPSQNLIKNLEVTPEMNIECLRYSTIKESIKEFERINKKEQFLFNKATFDKLYRSEDIIYSVKEFLNTRNSIPNLVSIQGLILSRNSYSSQSFFKLQPGIGSIGIKENTRKKLELSTLGNRGISVILRDLKTPDTVTIYIDQIRKSYTLSLLKGALVTFRSVTRLMSQKSKIYCQSNISTYIAVDKLPPPIASRVNSMDKFGLDLDKEYTKEDFHDVQLRYLKEFSTKDGENCQTIQAVKCHINLVRSIRLSYICVECGCVFKQGCCPNCLSHKAHFSSKASFLVDDGTNEACVHCGDKGIASLLGLTVHQWKSLQHLAYIHGEISYKQYGGSDWTVRGSSRHRTSLEQLLSGLCSSRLVCRPVMLFCKQFCPRDEKDTGYKEVTFDIGDSQYKTLVEPTIHLDSLLIHEVNNEEIIKNILFQA